jgi:DNA-binding LacI/PurR family transcriptional regulator
MAKTPTIRDVARRAGVSIATVSRVLNGRQPVHDLTRARVLEVMQELTFTPSFAARRLSLGRTQSISVIVSFLTRPQAAERLRGVDAVLSDSEFDLVFYNVESPDKRDQYLQKLAHAKRSDGLIVISLPPGPLAPAVLASAPIPVVFVDAHAPDLSLLPCVVGDDIAGGEVATRHLLELGHRRIAFVGDAFDSPFAFTSAHDRFSGYERALLDAGLPVRSDIVALGAHGRYEARELARRVLSVPEPPTAIFASSDTQALGVLTAARELGKDVPRELSVVGYDDIEAADYMGLTTMRQQLFESGRLGAELLLHEIESRSSPPASLKLEPSLVVRATSAPPGEGSA